MAGKSNIPEKQGNNYVNIAIDLILKVGSLFLVIFLCYKILKPFIGILIWGLIIAIILFPLYRKINEWFRKRNKLTSLIITLFFLTLLILPSIWLVNQLIDGIRILAGNFQDGNLKIPVPPETVSEWPLIGNWIYDHWLQLAENFGESVKGFMPQITNWIEKLLGVLADTGLGILQFAVSIIIAGIFLVFFEKGSDSGKRIFEKIIGERGEEFMIVSMRTIQSVATGILGVAIIQSALMGVGLIMAHIPLAAVWIIVILIMAIAQIPVLLFNIPMIIYLFAFMDPLPAALWSAYFLIMGLMDNVLKPMIMGKASDVPALVVFLGAIGGFIAFGFIGLFLGAIILSLAYKLYVTWIANES